MILDYITKIKSNITIYTNKKTTNVLDGAYKSIYKGRSMNFEDLREYVPGDSIKDIDWKASSRNRIPLVKRYIAEKKHNILLVFDSEYRMLGDSRGNQPKRDVAMLAGGTLGYIASKNGDNVGCLYATGDLIQYYQPKPGLNYLENLLQKYNSNVASKKNSGLAKCFDFITKCVKSTMIIVVITDIAGINKLDSGYLKLLEYKNDVLFICVSDADVTGNKAWGIDNNRYVPAFISDNKKMAKKEREMKEKLYAAGEKKLRECGVSGIVVDDSESLPTKILELLEKQRLYQGGVNDGIC